MSIDRRGLLIKSVATVVSLEIGDGVALTCAAHPIDPQWDGLCDLLEKCFDLVNEKKKSLAFVMNGRCFGYKYLSDTDSAEYVSCRLDEIEKAFGI